MYNILVVDDDKEIVKAIEIYLKKEGYKIFKAYNGIEALEIIANNEIHLIILDIMMPEKDGMETLEEIRKEKTIPVILLSAKSEDYDKIGGLNSGADDYITKPFSPKELVLRVNNVIKRVYKNDNNRIMIDGYELDEEQRKVFAGNTEIDLTTKEFDLLMMFIRNKGMAFSREKILELVWEDNYFGSDRVVDDTLRRLRKKLPKLHIHTIYGYGYRLG